MNNKKFYTLLTIFIMSLLILIFTKLGTTKSNSVLEKLNLEKETQEDLAVIVNNPENSIISELKNLHILRYDKNGQEMLIIPTNEGSEINITEVAYTEDGIFNDKKVLYTNENSLKDYTLLLQIYRPEGAPYLKINIEYEDKSKDYYISYDGKDGTPDVEYIR